MATKFHLLPVGMEFRYKERLFTKNAPLTAIDENGNQRMVPRSAVIEPIKAGSGAPTAVQPPRELLSTAAGEYHRKCQDVLQRVAPALDPETLRHADEELEAARQEFTRQLDKALQNVN